MTKRLTIEDLKQVDVNDHDQLAGLFRREKAPTTFPVNVRMRPDELEALDNMVMVAEATEGRKIGRAEFIRRALIFYCRAEGYEPNE